VGTPAQIGRYIVDRPLGEGGMANAVLAHHATSGEKVVLKIPHSAAADVKERVRDEARTGIRLSHPNIVETLDLVEHEGKPVLVVRFVEGCALKDWWKLGPAPVVAIAHVGAQIADALAAIHEATDEHGFPLGTLHRDVAPGNILINQEGNAMLIDLGIARSIESKAARTEVGVIKGTLRYLAPEILEGKPQSAQTDLWALGVCLFEVALGRRAVSGDDRAILSAVIHGKLTKLRDGEHIDPSLSSLIDTLLGAPGARFKDARAAADALAALRDAQASKQGGSTLGEEAGAAAAAAWVARCPQSNNVGEKPGEEDPHTIVDGSIAATVRSAEAWEGSTGSRPHISRGVELDASVGESGTAPTMRIAVVDESALRAGASAGGPAAPRAITFAQMPASDPGLVPHPARVRDEKAAATAAAPQTAPTVVIPAARWESSAEPAPSEAPDAPTRALESPIETAPAAAASWTSLAIGAAIAVVLIIAVVVFIL
jgi:serine/threonine protein kinase